MEFRNDEFWKEIPAWKNISAAEFTSHQWQAKNSILNIKDVKAALGNKINHSILEDLYLGQKKTPMNIRIIPYIFSLINWNDPLNDPLRKQFLPLGSQFLPEHPFTLSDPLAEESDSPVPLLTHRYPDKVLFLPLTVCPVYCSYCTRSRLVGGSTQKLEKELYGPNPEKWKKAFKYLQDNPNIEDVVISGGDTFQLPPRHILTIGKSLLDIPHIRRIRFATKGLAVLPMKIITDEAWLAAIKEIFEYGKQQHKQVVIHTHFSHPNEITSWTKQAMEIIFQMGILVRNQAVLQNGVNEKADIMIDLIKKLSHINIQPYYIYMHDMVSGCEHFRTTLKEAKQLEKAIRGITAGFNTPTIVCDLPEGGGKRHICSYEYYNEEFGISAWLSPKIKPGKIFYYYDPMHKLSKLAQQIWHHEKLREKMLSEVRTTIKTSMDL